ncbi:glycoside hydrolase family 65 protein [Vallitalea pronyensis]|uniref:Glycoside hydrolase family 65 protein n=1 Tax=Vallitalea pronyensis TaxID=1348613 RepID=A0A8J8MNG5_9FIRM|nr:glycoside hydrolase family 65 protein [Vallitalea pronyensis]QUI25157.1 glycoside hydrolase family 65 protein [Vallitalea pronyensis]
MHNIDVWGIKEDALDPNNYPLHETLFALGNGYIGTRGNFEEGTSFGGHDGTFINGFYDYYDLTYGEKYNGYPHRSHAMLNVTDGKRTAIFIQGEKLDLATGTIDDYERHINFREGILIRSFKWTSSKGYTVAYRSERLLSLDNKHLMLNKLTLTPLNFDGDITLVSSLDGDVTNITKADDPRIGVEFQGDELRVVKTQITHELGELVSKTKSSELGLITLMKHRLIYDGQIQRTLEQKDKFIAHHYTLAATNNKAITLEKYVTYHTYENTQHEQMDSASKKCIEEAYNLGYHAYVVKQKAYLHSFWEHADVEIKGDDATLQGIRFNMFHLLQSVGRDGYTNIAAKGLTGEGYEGHYFWDTEIYILPFFIYTNPNIAKKLVEYRYHLLDAARKRREDMQYKKGALYPWRTINGEECSAYYPAGTAQYHINADIAYTVCKYVEATNDEAFLVEAGLEMLIETARLWLQIGHYNDQEAFHICCVTGPDEYTAVVNNNVYTNLMAAHNLRNAYEAAKQIEKKYPKEYQALVDKIGLDSQELQDFDKASKKMYVPYDHKRKLYPQDDSFFQKPLWDFERSKDKRPILMHYHPLNIYRAQVCKQADLILLEFLLGHQFDQEQKKRDYDYYEKITTHDSSLSTCIFSIMANELGYYDKGYDYFIHSARTDIDDMHHNTTAGVHTANMAGTWLSIVFGFGGMREVDGELHFNAHLPQQWDSYSFHITFKDRRIRVKVDGDGVHFVLLEGEPLKVYDKGEALVISK